MTVNIDLLSQNTFFTRSPGLAFLIGIFLPTLDLSIVLSEELSPRIRNESVFQVLDLLITNEVVQWMALIAFLLNVVLETEMSREDPPIPNTFGDSRVLGFG
jgi:hypothetical protein